MTKTLIDEAIKRVPNWNVNGVTISPYRPSLEQFSEELYAMIREKVWADFIAHLNKVEPLGRLKDGDEPVYHKNFLGSIERYKKIYMEANNGHLSTAVVRIQT